MLAALLLSCYKLSMVTYKESRRGIGGRKRIAPVLPEQEIVRRPDETDEEWKLRYARENMRLWRLRNRQKELARRREQYRESPEIYGRERKWFKENPEKVKAYAKAHFERNREEKIAKLKAWCETNPDRHLAAKREWYARNPHMNAAYASKRRAAEFQATPVWADFDKIAAFYEEARRLTVETGIEHHVDHIIPLRGKTVCGLHVHTNLRVIPATENLRKRNKLPEEVAASLGA